MKLVFVIGAYNYKTNGNLEEYCKLELFEKSSDKAIERAKKLINKNYYEVIQIIEVKK